MRIFFACLAVLFCSEAWAEENAAAPEAEKKDIRRFLRYDVNDKTAPYYRKVRDEYILDLEQIQKNKEMPQNAAKDRDLARMSKEGGVKLY